MKYLNILKWGTGIVSLLLISSCNSWLDVKPEDKILEEDLVKTQEGFETALNGIYLGMAENSVYGKELSCGFIETLAQMYNMSQQTTGASNYYLPFMQYKYTDPSVKSTFESTWRKMYTLIANCNNLIEKAPLNRSVFADDAAYNGYMGQLYALRAFLHFDVFRLWGPVYNSGTMDEKCIPYYKIRTSLPVALSTAKEVVDNVLADLKTAESLLPHNKGSLAMNIGYHGVRALQARVYLYTGDKDKAFEVASDLVNTSGFHADYPFVTSSAVQNSTAPDRLFYTEQIFLLENSKRAKLYEDLFDYMLEDRVFLAPSAEQLKKLFPNDKDYRYFQWKVNPGNGKGVAFMKFAKISDDLNPVRTIAQSLLKISELYLILAECAPTVDERVDYLNTLRMRRGYQNGTITNAEKNDWQTTLQTEYNREFYGEGQYFFYLKRKNVASIKSADGKEDITMGPARYQLILPESESNYR